MELSGDELAGVVDLFGALTREELRSGLAELAFKHGEEADPEAFVEDVEEAIRTYYLVDAPATAIEDPAGAPGEILVPGPVAFPDPPEGAPDLPHILGIDERVPDREAVAKAAEERFREDAAAAVGAEDADRMETLLDVSYELEAWGAVDLSEPRERLDTALSA